MGLRSCRAFVAAFFDDPDEPQTVRIPCGDGDALTADLITLFSQEAFEIYLFDEHDRELIGTLATISSPDAFAARMAGLSFPKLLFEDAMEIHRAIIDWFGRRTATDDAAAYDVRFTENLYDDDRFIIEAHKPDLRGTNQPPHTSLVRDEPGEYQERDIGHLLWRVFPWEAVIANPVRANTERELCDLLVVLPDAILVIQAKDSPNTEASMRRTIKRKLATTLSHLDKAVGQLRGALNHLKASDVLELILPDGPVAIPLEDREIYGMIVLNEMFDDHFRDYSAPVLRLAQETGLPTVILDYPALHVMTNRTNDSYEFLSALDRIFALAAERSEYPRVESFAPPRRGR